MGGRGSERGGRGGGRGGGGVGGEGRGPSLRTVIIVSTNLSGVNGFGKHA